jgi:hypothetical protein
MILYEQAFKIGIDQRTLLVYILNSYWFMMKRFETAQRERFWKRGTFLDT